MFHAPHIPNSNKSSAAFSVTAENSTEPSKGTGVLMDVTRPHQSFGGVLKSWEWALNPGITC